MSDSSGTKITVRVQPNAARNEIVGFSEGVLRIKISEPPVKDKANKELIAFLSERLGLSKGSVGIVKGHTSRNKVIAIHSLSREDILRRLLPAE